MTKIKFYLIVAAIAIFATLVVVLQYQSNKIDRLEKDLSQEKAKTEILSAEAATKIKALEDREKNLQKDYERTQNEYKKLKDARSNSDYAAWADSPLPDVVLNIMRNK